MEIYNKNFIGPVEIQPDSLPNTPAIYIISKKGSFDPQYIGFTTFLNSRLKQHPILVKLNLNELQLFYYTFNEEQKDEALEIEKKLVTEFKPPFNKSYIHKDNMQAKVERTQKYSNFLALVSSSIAIAALIFTVMGLFLNNEPRMSNSELTVKSTELQKAIAMNNEATIKLRLEINSIQSKLEAITSVPEKVVWKVESEKINQRIIQLEEKLKALETALASSPIKALAVPILRKDLDNAQEVFKSEIVQTRSEINRIYDQNKWFIGLMFTIALSVLGMAISNFMGKKDF